jgi:predicted TPR repeat methyltransferase
VPEQPPSTPGEEHVRLEDAYALQTPDDSRQLYARWATTYESTFVAEQQYVIPRRVAETFAAEVDAAGIAAAGPVLDVGCGTGLAASALAELLPRLVIDGADISPEMLAQAARKQRAGGAPVYRRLVEVDLTAPSDVADGSYGGIISSGTFTHGHLGPEIVPTVLRFTASGALVALGINAEHFVVRRFDAMLDGLAASGTIIDVRLPQVEMYLPGSEHFGERAVIALFRVA